MTSPIEEVPRIDSTMRRLKFLWSRTSKTTVHRAADTFAHYENAAMGDAEAGRQQLCLRLEGERHLLRLERDERSGVHVRTERMTHAVTHQRIKLKQE